MGSTVGNVAVLIDVDTAYNPNKVPSGKKCYFFSSSSGNMSASDDANCDQVQCVPLENKFSSIKTYQSNHIGGYFFPLSVLLLSWTRISKLQSIFNFYFL